MVLSFIMIQCCDKHFTLNCFVTNVYPMLTAALILVGRVLKAFVMPDAIKSNKIKSAPFLSKPNFDECIYLYTLFYKKHLCTYFEILKKICLLLLDYQFATI